MPFENRKEKLRGSVQYFHHFKNLPRSVNLKFNNVGIFQSLKLRISMEKIFPISFKLIFTPNTVGCHGFTSVLYS